MDKGARWGAKPLLVATACVTLIVSVASGQQTARITGRQLKAVREWTEMLLDCVEDPASGYAAFDEAYEKQLAIEGTSTDDVVFILAAMKVAGYTEGYRATLVSRVGNMLADKKHVETLTTDIEKLAKEIKESKPDKAGSVTSRQDAARSAMSAPWALARGSQPTRAQSQEDSPLRQKLTRLKRDLVFAKDSYCAGVSELRRQSADMLVDVGIYTGEQVMARYNETEALPVKLHLLEVAGEISKQVPKKESYVDFFVEQTRSETAGIRFMALSALGNFPGSVQARDALLATLQASVDSDDSTSKGAAISSLYVFAQSREVAVAALAVLKDPKKRQGVELSVIKIIMKNTGEDFDRSAGAVSQQSYNRELSRFLKVVGEHLAP